MARDGRLATAELEAGGQCGQDGDAEDDQGEAYGAASVRCRVRCGHGFRPRPAGRPVSGCGVPGGRRGRPTIAMISVPTTRSTMLLPRRSLIVPRSVKPPSWPGGPPPPRMATATVPY